MATRAGTQLAPTASRRAAAPEDRPGAPEAAVPGEHLVLTVQAEAASSPATDTGMGDTVTGITDTVAVRAVLDSPVSKR